MPPNGIPDRWEQYSSVGKRISGTNFIAFKVPLNERLSKRLPSDQRFTPAMLMEKVNKLSLIIDLTNTTRYYYPEEFTTNRIQYQKIFCEGHKVPNAQVVQRFFNTVEEHLRVSKDQDNLIGVHCTHGVNRTGYLVCLYMIEKLGFTAADAIKEFNLARGSNMERANYIECLKSGRLQANPRPPGRNDRSLVQRHRFNPENQTRKPYSRGQPNNGPSAHPNWHDRPDIPEFRMAEGHPSPSQWGHPHRTSRTPYVIPPLPTHPTSGQSNYHPSRQHQGGNPYKWSSKGDQQRPVPYGRPSLANRRDMHPVPATRQHSNSHVRWQ